MIKRKNVILVGIVLMTVLVFAGCSRQKAAEPISGPVNLTIAGGSIGGAWAAIGEGVAEAIRRTYTGSNVAYEVGSEAANIALVSSNKFELGVAHSGLVKMAMEGAGPFDGKKMPNLRAVAVLHEEAAQHFIVRTSAGVKSYPDIATHPFKVNMNTKDSFMEVVAKATLEAYGISYDQIRNNGGAVDFMSMGTSLNLMRDNRIQSHSNLIQMPSSHVIDAAINMDLVLLPMSEEAIKKVNAAVGTYKTIIPKGTYSFLKEDIPTVAGTLILVTNTDVPEDVIYKVVRSMGENVNYLKTIHASLADLTIEAMQRVAPAELHAGAVKYFKEIKK